MLNKNTTFCPVCGFDLEVKIFDNEHFGKMSGEICPSCNSEFDYDLFPNENSFLKNRIRWISQGMNYGRPELRSKYPNTFSKIPQNWNPVTQLKNINIDLTDPRVQEEYKKEIPNLMEIIKPYIEK